MARSHALVLRRVVDRGLYLPPLARRLSLSLFYNYLASECQRHRRFRQSLTWLSRSAWHGMPWICAMPGFYAFVGRALLQSDGPTQPSATVPNASRRGTARSVDGILLQNIHRLLTRLYGQTPRRTATDHEPDLEGEGFPQTPPNKVR